jgi:hypothetical protein
MWMIDTLRRGIREKKVRPILLAAGGMILPFVAGLAMLAAIGSENRIAVILLLFLPNPITVEGGFILVLMGVLFYLLRNWRLVQAALILVIGALIWFVSKNPQGLMAAAIIPILLYNGQRGRGNKYFFYIFYPAHIYLFYTIAWLIR